MHERIQAFLDGEITRGSREEAALQAHLDVCPDCRRLLTELQGTRGLLACWQPPAVPAETGDRLTAALAERMARCPWWQLPPTRLAWVLGSLLLALGITAYVLQPQQPTQVQVALRPVMQPQTISAVPAQRYPKLAIQRATTSPTPAASAMGDRTLAKFRRQMPILRETVMPVDAASNAVEELAETGATPAAPVPDGYVGSIIREERERTGDAITLDAMTLASDTPPEETVLAMLTETQ
jgi:hypothetical protein